MTKLEERILDNLDRQIENSDRIEPPEELKKIEEQEDTLETLIDLLKAHGCKSNDDTSHDVNYDGEETPTVASIIEKLELVFGELEDARVELQHKWSDDFGAIADNATELRTDLQWEISKAETARAQRDFWA